MKRIISLLLLVFMTPAARSQTIDSLVVHYYENFPYAYMESGKIRGIEVEIVEEYVSWLRQKKGLQVAVRFQPFTQFSQFYQSVVSGSQKVIGLGSVSNVPGRDKEVTFAPPYLQNVSVLITNGRVPTVREKNAAEISKVFTGLGGVAVQGSSHLGYLNAIKKNYLPSLSIHTVESQHQVLESIISQNNFGYVDLVAYWAFLKNNPKFIKIQKVFTEHNERLSFILPLKNIHGPMLSEFFESGFGFTATKKYHEILTNYLGHEIIESVEIR